MQQHELKTVHTLKTWVEYFKEVWDKTKKFEVRFNDREFKKGDILQLQEFDHEKEEYTGRELFCDIDYILVGGDFGIDQNYVVMSIKVKRKIDSSDLPF